MKEMTDIDYLQIATDEMYDYITGPGFVWPIHFTIVRRKEFLNILIQHYTDDEQYEKSSRLSTMIKKIEEYGE